VQDSQLARKIGQVLMVVHDYQRAVDYYNKAIRNAPGDVQLQHELGAFLVRMQQWGPAEVCLQRCLDRTKESSPGLESMQVDVETYATVDVQALENSLCISMDSSRR
jgi:tetratricopeptide repeat protein 21B